MEIDAPAVAAAFAQPGFDGAFDGPLGDYMRMIALRRPVLFFAFAPKAAGTFLRTAAIHAVNGNLVRAVHAQGGRDAQLYLPIFIQYYLGGLCEGPMVVHAHMQALPGNRHFLDALGIRPVVMLRPIPDMLASYCDMLSASEQARAEGLNCPIPPDFANYSQAHKSDFLVDVVAPWYAGYFATWADAARHAPDEICVLRYADLLADPAAVLQTALAHADLPRSRAACQAALDIAWRDRGTLRFNQGRAGRGTEYFSTAQLRRLERLLSYHPSLEQWRGTLM